MDYNEEIAKKIIADFGLSANTLKVWKSRNSIPDKYATAEPSAQVEDERLIRQLRLVITSAKINLSALSKSSGVALNDFAHAKSNRMTEADYVKVKKTLNKIRLSGLKLVTEINKIGRFVVRRILKA